MNTLLWLDSFDRYLSSRYHVMLSVIVPDEVFVISRNTQALLARAQQALRTTPVRAEPLIQQALRTTPVRAEPLIQQAQGSPQETLTATPVAPEPVAPEPVAPAPPPVPVTPAPVSTLETPAVARVSSSSSEGVGRLPKVLFAGDSMMQGVAPLAINQLRKDNPSGTFIDLSAQSTGLTVRRYFDWPTKIKDETLTRGFEVVAIFLGPNDPWDIYEGSKRYAFGSTEWEDKYRERVIEVMQFAKDQKVHVIWIGLPNMKEERIKRGAIIQNRIFREQAKHFDFDYLSTEDFLGALDEPFKKYSEEPGKGQIMLRAEDGIHFTPTGLRLISARLYARIQQQARHP